MRVYRVRYTPEAAGRIRTLHPDIKKQIRAPADRSVQSPLEGHPVSRRRFETGPLWRSVTGPPTKLKQKLKPVVLFP